MRFDNLRRRILDVIAKAGSKGILAPEIAKVLHLPRHTRVSPRLSELRQMAEIGARGTRKHQESGEDNAIWVLLKYLSPEEKRYEKQLRDLWEVRRQINRRMAKLPLAKRLAALKLFLSQLSRVAP